MPAEPGREFQWDSRWGRGWPGWHIECAAMALKYLGPGFDVHVGGIDLRFPHHENSRAVAETATGKRLAAIWMHAAHLLVEGRKMSKSAGNEYTLDDLEKGPPGGGRGFSPEDFRYYCLTLHYASPMNFTWEGQQAAARARSRLRAAFRRAAPKATSGEDVAAALRAEFRGAVSDNLNMPRALAVVHKAVRQGIGGDAARSLAAEWDAILAVGLLSEADAECEAIGVGSKDRGKGFRPQSRRWRGNGRPEGGRAIIRRRTRCARGSAPRGTMSWTRRKEPRFFGKFRETRGR